MADMVPILSYTDDVISLSVSRLHVLVKACRIVGLETMADELLDVSKDLTDRIGVSLQAYTVEMQEQTAHAKELCGNFLVGALRGQFREPQSEAKEKQDAAGV